MVALATLEATVEEKKLPYWLNIEEDLAVGVQYTPPEYNFTAATRARRQQSDQGATVAGKRKRQTYTSKQSTSLPTNASVEKQIPKKMTVRIASLPPKAPMPMQKPSSVLGTKYNKWRIFRAELPTLLNKALDEKLPALLNKALDENLPALFNKALDENLTALFNKALAEKVHDLVNKALEEKLPAHPMHNEGYFGPGEGAKGPEKVEESPDKSNQLSDNKDDAQSQVPDNKSHVSWVLLHYLLLFG